MSNVLRVGGATKLKATFTVSKVKTDPTTVTLEVRDPGGNTDTYTYAAAQITKDATGVYSKMVEVDQAGMWTYEWHGDGAVVVVDGKQFYVQEQLI